MAEIIDFRALVVIDESMPTPHTICASSASPTWHSTYEAAMASVPTDMVCSA